MNIKTRDENEITKKTVETLLIHPIVLKATVKTKLKITGVDNLKNETNQFSKF